MEYRSLEHKIRDLWIAEANRNTEMRRKVANVGRPTDNVKDETSKLGKQGEIKSKIIDEAADGDIGKEVDSKKKDNSDSKKKPKDSDMDDIEAKTITGGKTEVDTEPKTDDSTENSTDEDKKSKKARNQENKTIGAKGVKEETMLRSDKNHGSSQSLIDAISEALKGKKKVEEEVVDEGNANLIKKIEKQKPKAIEKGFDYPSKDPKTADRKTLTSFHKEIKKFNKEEVESIEELSKETMGSYKGKAEKSLKGAFAGKDEKSAHTVSKRLHGLSNPKIAKEEVEAVDEASNAANKIKKGDYETKVGTSAIADKDNEHGAWGRETIKRGLNPDVAKRHQGRLIAKGRSTNNMHQKGSDVVRKEETDPGFSEAELARIEEIANNIDEVVTARKLTAADKAARAKYLEGHKAKMAGMAQHAVKGDAKSFKDRNTETGDYTKEPSKMHKTGLLNVLTKQDTKRD